MQVKIKIKDKIAETDKAILFLISEKEIWLPKALFRYGKGNYIICPQWLADEKHVKYSTFMHIPEKINPIKNQEAIDELIY